MKYTLSVRHKFAGKDFPVFTLRDIRLYLEDKKISDGYLYLLVHNLMEKKEITRITKAVYTFHDDAAVVGFAFRPFYYGFENALNIRGISEQGTNFIVVTPKNVRAGVRAFKGRNFVIRRIKSPMFFGFDIIKYNGFWIPVSDVEKTLIDLIYFGNHIRAELWPEMLKVLNKRKLEGYLERYNKKFRERVSKEISTRPKPPLSTP